MKSLQSLQDEIGEWSDTNPTTLEGILNHLVEESEDLAANPYDVLNYADVLILLLTAARKANYSIEDLTKGVEVKHKINLAREWAQADENGVRRHI